MLKKRIFVCITTTFLLIYAVTLKAFCGDDFILGATEKIRAGMLENGKYEEAVRELEDLSVNYPENGIIYMSLGIAYYGLMEYKKAYEFFRKAEEAGVREEFTELLGYAIRKLDENKTLFADIENIKKATSESGATSEESKREKLALLHYEALRKLLEDKYYYPAIVTAHIIWLKENMPGSEVLYRLSGDIYYSTAYYKKAAEDYKKAIETGLESAAVYEALGNSLFALGNLKGADESYDKAILLYKKDSRDNNTETIALLETIRKTLPKKYDDIDELIKRDSYGEAEALCKNKISLNPYDYAAFTQLGEAYWKKGDRKKAAKFFKKAIKINPDYPPAHFLMGKYYIFAHKADRGMAEFDAFDKGMNILPKMAGSVLDYYVSASHYISYMYATQKEYQKAIEECNKIIKLRPDDQAAHYNLGVSYYLHYRDRQKVYNEMQEVININPNTVIAEKAKFYIDFIRRNPDPRIMGDFTFVYEKEEGID